MRKRRESYQPRDARQGLFREKNLIEESTSALAIFRLKNVSGFEPATGKNDALSYEREGYVTEFYSRVQEQSRANMSESD
jgi:hypothetical protein